ncbi:MAG: 30S ribosomal protein S8 [Alphaproteobacteria bacterium]
MTMSDPIADMLTRIRNAHKAEKSSVAVLPSKIHKGICEVLEREGFIRGFSEKEIRKNISEIIVELKYHDDKPVIKEIKRVSTPGRRVYSGSQELPKVYNGLGILILSTPNGYLSDYEARQANVGGEILCEVF